MFEPKMDRIFNTFHNGLFSSWASSNAALEFAQAEFSIDE